MAWQALKHSAGIQMSAWSHSWVPLMALHPSLVLSLHVLHPYNRTDYNTSIQKKLFVVRTMYPWFI